MKTHLNKIGKIYIGCKEKLKKKLIHEKKSRARILK